MKNWIVLAIISSCLALKSSAADFAEEIIQYNPGVGFATDFSTGAGYTNTTAALGQPSRLNPGPFGGPVDPFNPPFQADQLLSIGAGGSVTVRLGRLVLNDPAHAFGIDFLIFGNSGFVITNNIYSGGGITDGSIFSQNTGQTRVSVSSNNVQYYELDPSLAPVVDGYFPTDGLGDFHTAVNPQLDARAFAGGGLTQIRSLYNGAAGGTGFDLTWARDLSGQPIRLDSIQYVRVDVLSGASEIDGFAVVPEPGAWSLFGLGLVSVALFRPFGRRARRRGLTSTAKAALALTFLGSTGILNTPASPMAREEFAVNPATAGWETFGDPSVFQWNSAEQLLEVTWDSRASNSYFFRRLGTVLTKLDDFAFGFDLRLSDATAGINPEQPFTFQIAAGFIHLQSATQNSFRRGTGSDAANVVEFNYFPDSGFGATIAPVAISSNHRIVSSFNFPIELAPGDLYSFDLQFSRETQTLQTSARRNGTVFGPIKELRLPADFGDFRLDAFSVNCYSSSGAGGSILAHGQIDNIRLQLPPPPVGGITGQFSEGQWTVTFTGSSNWVYTLERSIDLRNWLAVGAPVPGSPAPQTLPDLEPISRAFYRVAASRP